MTKDPYEVLGVSRSASDDEIKQAYRRLAKQYHPDMHPGDKTAADKMNEINAAYEQIKNPQKAQQDAQAGGYGSSAYDNSYGGSNPYSGQNSEDPFNEFFRNFGFGGNQYYSNANAYRQRTQQGPAEFQAARHYVDVGEYQDAINVLNSVSAEDRTAEWHFLFAVAAYSLGNRIQAMQEIQIALQMDPDNIEYEQARRRMQSGSNFYQQNGGFRTIQTSPFSLCTICGTFYLAQILCCGSRGMMFCI